MVALLNFVERHERFTLQRLTLSKSDGSNGDAALGSRRPTQETNELQTIACLFDTIEQDDPFPTPDIETVVISGGVVGLAIATERPKARQETCVLEPHNMIGQEMCTTHVTVFRLLAANYRPNRVPQQPQLPRDRLHRQHPQNAPCRRSHRAISTGASRVRSKLHAG